jgi:hypothetical protein
MKDQRYAFDSPGAVGFGAQVSIEHLDLRARVRLCELKEPLCLGSVAEKATDIRVPMDQQAFDDIGSKEASGSCDQNLQALTSG